MGAQSVTVTHAPQRVDVAQSVTAVDVRVQAARVDVEQAVQPVEVTYQAVQVVVLSGGPRGAPGTGAGVVIATVSGPVSALRAVAIEHGVARYPDLAVATDAPLVPGITRTAADVGGTVEVQTSGPLTDNSWNWSPGLIWSGAAGVLTQSPPVGAFLLPVARAISATQIDINVLQPTIRS